MQLIFDAAGVAWIDDGGSRRVVAARRLAEFQRGETPPAPPRDMSGHEQAMRLVAHIREMGYGDLIGWRFSAGLVSEFYDAWCASENIMPMPHSILATRLAAVPGVEVTRQRINGAGFAPLRAYLARVGLLRERSDANRVYVYRIASPEEIAAAAKAADAERPKRKRSGAAPIAAAPREAPLRRESAAGKKRAAQADMFEERAAA